LAGIPFPGRQISHARSGPTDTSSRGTPGLCRPADLPDTLSLSMRSEIKSVFLYFCYRSGINTASFFEVKIMPLRTIRVCDCPICQQETPHPDQTVHQRLNLLLSRMDEQQRRWIVAHEAQRLGHGGDKYLSVITGMDEKTIARGRHELAAGLNPCPTTRLRQPGGGRPPAEKKTTP
jgi:hypothetical protein